jgi:selenocysteine lyase/cysteine desulfurase
VGLSRTHEAFGQRDEAALASLGAALEFQDSIGRSVIEARVRALVQRLADGLRRIDGVSLWTSVDPLRSGGILVARPAAIEPRKLVSDLYTRDKIVCAAAGGATRPGVRFSPHFYNTIDEIDRTVAAVRSYV